VVEVVDAELVPAVVVMVVDVAVSTVDACSVETPALLGTKLRSPAAGDV